MALTRTASSAWKKSLAWLDSILWTFSPVAFGLILCGLADTYIRHVNILRLFSFAHGTKDRVLFLLLTLFLVWNVPRLAWKCWKWFDESWAGGKES